jgi:hypothetical protein
LLPGPACVTAIKEEFIRGREPKHRCAVHQAFRVVTESGSTQRHVYECFPSEYQTWVLEERIPQPPAGAKRIAAISTQDGMLLSDLPIDNRKSSNPQSPIHNRQSSSSNSQSFRILSPLPGDIFKIDPVLRPEYQSIKILAAIPQQFFDVKLVVNKNDKMPFDPAGTWWMLKKGTQRLQLEAKNGNRVVLSKPVTVQVD